MVGALGTTTGTGVPDLAALCVAVVWAWSAGATGWYVGRGYACGECKHFGVGSGELDGELADGGSESCH